MGPLEKMLAATDSGATVRSAPRNAPPANIFEGKPDARQSAGTPPGGVTVFRPRYRALQPEEIAMHDTIKTKAAELYDMFNLLPPGREVSLAKTELETAVMWAVKGLTK